MKIAIVTRNMGAGGAERVISQLLDSWIKKGHNLSLILLDNCEDFYPVPSDVSVFRIGQVSKNPLFDKIGRYAKVRNRVKEINPDVVLTLPEEIGIYVIGALLFTRIPVVVSERNDPRSMPNKKVTRQLREVLYPYADGFIFQTTGAASFFRENIRKKGTVIPNPLDLSRIPEPYVGEREKVIAGAGRFEKQKNFPLLIEAFAKFYATHPDYKLVIYGDGSLRDQWTEYARSLLPKTAFSFPGKVNDLPHKLSKVSAFVLCSDFEGMPNVLIEAMASGVPSISTNCPAGGSAALIKQGENGILVPVRDSQVMAEAICYMADNPEDAELMGFAASEICNELDAENICSKWLAFLEKTVNRSKK